MTILSEVVDAVIGADTHRDTHTLEMVTPVGVTISKITITNTDAGFTHLLSWISEQAPGPELVAAVEGTRSYGIGLARVLTNVGITVVEAEHPKKNRRTQGKTDTIDAHLAAVSALRMDDQTLTSPRVDGAREGLRVLLGARRDLSGSQTRHINQLRALLLVGDDTDRELARKLLANDRLKTIARRRGTQSDPIDQVIRRNECRRLALAIIQSRAELAVNNNQLGELVTELAPSLLEMTGGLRLT